MPEPADRLGQLLRDFDFRALLVEGLGWNHYEASLAPIAVDAHDYTFEPVAEKAGFAVYLCSPGPSGAIPPYAVRRTIEREVARLAFEHVIVFVDTRRRTQVWQWVKRESGARDVCREQWFRRGLSGESLLQSLRGMAFSLDEEASIDAVEVTSRVRRAFDAETLYSRFTEGFRRRTVAAEEAEPASVPPASAAEAAFTAELANALRGKHPRWTERIERIDALDEHTGQYPGIVVRHPGGAPVVVSTGFGHATAAEDAARDSVGALVEGAHGGADAEVEQAIAVRVPDELRASGAAGVRLDEAVFRYCVLTRHEGEPADPARWPAAGWLSGGLDDLAGLIERAALSERRITEGTRILEEGVGQAATMLRSRLIAGEPGALARIAEALHQEDGDQTSRMAMTIVANALGMV